MGRQTRTLMGAAGLSLVDQTKVIAAASELARYVADCAEEGKVCPEVIEGDGRRGVRLAFEGQAPGIPDIQAALKDGFTTGSGSASGLAERDG